MLGSLPGSCGVNFRLLVTVTGTSALEGTGERSLFTYPVFCISLRPISYGPPKVDQGSIENGFWNR